MENKIQIIEKKLKNKTSYKATVFSSEDSEDTNLNTCKTEISGVNC